MPSVLPELGLTASSHMFNSIYFLTFPNTFVTWGLCSCFQTLYSMVVVVGSYQWKLKPVQLRQTVATASG